MRWWCGSRLWSHGEVLSRRSSARVSGASWRAVHDLRVERHSGPASWWGTQAAARILSLGLRRAGSDHAVSQTKVGRSLSHHLYTLSWRGVIGVLRPFCRIGVAPLAAKLLPRYPCLRHLQDPASTVSEAMLVAVRMGQVLLGVLYLFLEPPGLRHYQEDLRWM